MCALGFIWYNVHSVLVNLGSQVQQGIGLQAVPGGAGERLTVSALSRRTASGQRTEANLRSAMYWRFRRGDCAVKLQRRLGCIVIDIGSTGFGGCGHWRKSVVGPRQVFVRRQRAVIPQASVMLVVVRLSWLCL